jgi:hypothetical protein
MTDITALTSDYLAMSEPLLETSNRVFSDWVVYTFFKIEKGIPVAHFEVRDKMFSHNTLFETDSYKELEDWVSAHSEEIQEQINKNKKNWIDKYGSNK